MTLPPLPACFFSSLGPLKVVFLGVKAARKMCGKFSFVKRTISIAPAMDLKAQWMTLWHEATHAALADSGANNVLTHEQAEAICDAMGNYLAAMMVAGWLTVTVPHDTVKEL
jgi:hypothetical protein